MPITINGTTVTTNSINGTAISSETVNGTQVYGGAVSKTKEWVFIYAESSQPATNLGIYRSSTTTTSHWLNQLTQYWSPSNYAVGTTAAVTYDYSNFYVYQIQEV